MFSFKPLYDLVWVVWCFSQGEKDFRDKIPLFFSKEKNTNTHTKTSIILVSKPISSCFLEASFLPEKILYLSKGKKTKPRHSIRLF